MAKSQAGFEVEEVERLEMMAGGLMDGYFISR